MLSLLVLYVIVECFSGIELVTVQVEVEQGRLAGEEVNSILNQKYYSFKSIPYAASPVGKLRFKDPQPPLPWERVRDATKDAPKCPQVDILSNIYLPGDEDCLFLNVYSPYIKPKWLLPVMFFIHGGGFKSGSGNVDTYSSDFLVYHNVVVVTINYRLENLGFLYLGDENVPGNAGMKDQVAALKWVQRNIHVFGGNPDCVTIFGQSAGGASVAYHVLSPMSKGLFKRAIIMSGVPYCDWALPYQPRRRAFALGKLLGKDTTDANELFEFLQSVPVESLVNVSATVLASEEITNNILVKALASTPVIEKDLGLEHFLTVDPKKLLKRGFINKADILIGHTNEEMIIIVPLFESSYIPVYNKYPELLVPRQILLTRPADTVLEVADLVHQHYFGNNSISTDTMREFVTYTNDDAFIYQTMRFLKDLPKVANEKRYTYILSALSDRNVYGKAAAKYNIFGLGHIEDLLYLFDPKALNLSLDLNSKEYKLIQLICTLFTNFAKYGNPTPDDSLGAIWPEYDRKNKYYANIAEKKPIEIGTSPNYATVQFWKSIYEYAGLIF